MRRAVAVVLALAAAATAAAPTASADEGPVPVAYQPPVDAPVVAGFRPPATPYGPGNVGVDYATGPGTPVGAAAPGRVAFAGRVGGGLHVVVLHPDGLRTSYSFLASVAVRRGQEVGAGDAVGTSGPSLHFGARAGDAYLDPLVLLGGVDRPAVRLVPDGEGAMGSEGDERRGLTRYLGAAGRAVGAVAGAAVSWAARVPGRVVGAVPTPAEAFTWFWAVGSVAGPTWYRLGRAAADWWAARTACTPSSVAPPPPAGRRRVVLVAGLGSTSTHASVDDLDTTALGYARTDVARFSYAGGTTAEHPYGAADTQQDMAESGRRLRDLLERLAAADPGVPIDVVAHSQGGLVARAALGRRAPPGVVTLVTLASPHGGADLATAGALMDHEPKLGAALEAAGRVRPGGIDPTSASVGQLAETSSFVRDLNAHPPPPGVRVTSVGGQGDVVVPSPRTRLPGAAHVVVAVPGLNDHAGLPGSPAAAREVALAVAGMAPTCQGFWDATADAVAGELIATNEDLLGLAATVGSAVAGG